MYRCDAASHGSWLRAAIVSAVMVTAVLAGWCEAQSTGGVGVQQALDREADIALRDVTLGEAFSRIGEKLGVQLQVDDHALCQLPYGGETRLSEVQLQGMSWGDALGELLEPLLLRYEVGRDRVFVVGTAELMRQPRAVNSMERSALAALRGAGLNDSTDKLLKQIRQVTRMNFGLVVGERREEEADDDIVERILGKQPQSAASVLDQYSRRLLEGRDGTWYVRADMDHGETGQVDIVVLVGSQLTQMKLERRVYVEYKGRRVEEVVGDLADRAAVELTYEPGCLAMLEDRVRERVTLAVRGGTVRSALEALAGLTGLEFVRTAGGIEVSASEALRESASRRTEVYTSSNPTVCVIQGRVPGTELETMVIVREQDLASRGLLEKYQQFQQMSINEFIEFLEGYEPEGGQ